MGSVLEYRRGLIERLVSEGSPTKRLKHVESLIRSLNGRSYEKGPKTKIRVGTNAFPASFSFLTTRMSLTHGYRNFLVTLIFMKTETNGERRVFFLVVLFIRYNIRV